MALQSISIDKCKVIIIDRKDSKRDGKRVLGVCKRKTKGVTCHLLTRNFMTATTRLLLSSFPVTMQIYEFISYTSRNSTIESSLSDSDSDSLECRMSAKDCMLRCNVT